MCEIPIFGLSFNEYKNIYLDDINKITNKNIVNNNFLSILHFFVLLLLHNKYINENTPAIMKQTDIITICSSISL